MFGRYSHLFYTYQAGEISMIDTIEGPVIKATNFQYFIANTKSSTFHEGVIIADSGSHMDVKGVIFSELRLLRRRSHSN